MQWKESRSAIVMATITLCYVQCLKYKYFNVVPLLNHIESENEIQYIDVLSLYLSIIIKKAT